jgi:hypothetical protein
MRFLVLLHGDPDREASLSVAERRQIVEQHVAFTRWLSERGALVVGEALAPAGEGRTMRFDDGADPVMTDGPFLETKEALGGFYVLECPSIEEAADILRRVPRSPGLAVEIRPVAGG